MFVYVMLQSVKYFKEFQKKKNLYVINVAQSTYYRLNHKMIYCFDQRSLYKYYGNVFHFKLDRWAFV